jgi:pimeloyl-ACP methyl ester carboxylesterase
VDPGHPFPFIPNLGFGLVMNLESLTGGGDPMEALIIIPSQMNRFIPHCPDRRCTVVRPGRVRLRRLILRCGIRLLDALLLIAPNPDAAIARLVGLNRMACGLQCLYRKVDGAVWPYLQGGGRGEPVVLLHGFGATKDNMIPLAHALCRSPCRVVIPDLPGFGDHTPDWSAVYDVESQALRLERFIDSLGLGRAHLIGVSLGGYVAAWYAARFSERIRSLCLMDGAGFGSPVASDAMALYDRAGRNVFLYSSPEAFEIFMGFLVHRFPGMPGRLTRHWARWGIERLEWRRKLFDDLVRGGLYMLDGMAGRITAPTLVLWGMQDRICHVSAVSTALERIGDCRAYIFDPCGHLPMIEYPRLSRSIVAGFLRRCARGNDRRFSGFGKADAAPSA